jgi:hypothetical protein
MELVVTVSLWCTFHDIQGQILQSYAVFTSSTGMYLRKANREDSGVHRTVKNAAERLK